MNTELLSEQEINARYFGEWVLVEEIEIDDQLRLVRGIVTIHDKNREVVEKATRRYAQSPRPFAIQFFGPQPERIYLLGAHLSE